MNREKPDNKQLSNNEIFSKNIERIYNVIIQIAEGNFDIDICVCPNNEFEKVSIALKKLRDTYKEKIDEFIIFEKLTKSINDGVTLDDILNLIYEQFKLYIPFNRIGLALIEEDGKKVRAHWSKSESIENHITYGYSASLQDSSLKKIIETKEPRIINDLEEYLAENPSSESTKKIISEGIRSSLTCPLISMGKPIGFLFFSSSKKNTYKNLHVDIFKQIAGQVSSAIDKGRMIQELSELNQIRNKFVGIVAHDLRSPLGVIKGFIDIMLKGIFGELNETQQKYIQKMNKVSQGMLLLIDDLLDMSAVETGNLRLELNDCNLNDALKEWHEYNSVLAKTKSMELVLDAEDNFPIVRMDINRISQVVNNLISNAIKYSFPNTKIILKARVVNSNIEISVTDEGQGIPEHELSLIFDQYGRGSVRPTGGEKSIGLGLAIVKHIIKAHEGHIYVQSKVHEGSTFVFTIPVKGPDLNIKTTLKEL